MEQLILHLIGDYVTQTEKMATSKTNSTLWASLHAFIYTAPFTLITQSAPALILIFITHLLIDRFRLARYVIFIKNKVTDINLKWSDCSGTGYHKNTPAWLSVWLMIIVDNAMHLSINYLCIKYL